MGDEAPDSPEEEVTSRPPTREDLVALCGHLNALGAKYVVVGGFAVIHAGYARVTEDLNLLIDTSAENESRVYQALATLPDRAVLELQPGELARYVVVRVADEITVDLMRSACAIEYAEAAQHVVTRVVDGVAIPFASPLLLWRMKRHTHREKDIPDLIFLRRLLESEGITPPE